MPLYLLVADLGTVNVLTASLAHNVERNELTGLNAELLGLLGDAHGAN